MHLRLKEQAKITVGTMSTDVVVSLKRKHCTFCQSCVRILSWYFEGKKQGWLSTLTAGPRDFGVDVC
jgi:hypothetical protein